MKAMRRCGKNEQNYIKECTLISKKKNEIKISMKSIKTCSLMPSPQKCSVSVILKRKIKFRSIYSHFPLFYISGPVQEGSQMSRPETYLMTINKRMLFFSMRSSQHRPFERSNIFCSLLVHVSLSQQNLNKKK